MGPIAAILVAVCWSTVALLIAWSRGYTRGGMALCLAGIIGGGVGAGLPGAYALTGGWSVIIHNSTQGSAACMAVLIGALFGLYIAERIREGQFPTNRQLMTAFFGFLFGVMAGLIILAFAYQTWANNLALFGLIPVTIGTATLAGSAVSHPIPD